MKHIVIAVQGFVFLGALAEDAPAGWLYLTDASCIRVWGTSAGLGQIALTGPTGDTVLDPSGEVQFPLTSVVAVIPCRW